MTEMTTTKAPGRGLRIAAWIAQLLVTAMFCMAGTMKLTQPIAELAKMMPWTGVLPEAAVRTIGLIDLAGGVGILLPALLRIKPQLTVAAAIGCSLLQVCAIVFHLSRGEASVVPLNIVLLAASIFVFWVRSRKAPISPR